MDSIPLNLNKKMGRREFIKKGSGGIIGLTVAPIHSEKLNFNDQNKPNMTTPRMKTFDVPHKGIRNGLAQLSLLSGKTNYNDSVEAEQLYTLGKEIFLLLNTHAHDENDVSLKYLEQKMKGASHHDIEEHIRIHVAQSRLEKMLDTIYEDSKRGKDVSEAASEFYTSIADFHATYLNHMSEEERITQQLLWDNFTDEELAGHRTEIMKKLNPDTLLLWFKYIAPAQSHKERVGLFKAFKANAPEPFFNRAEKVLSEVLTKKEFDLLMAEL
jgi:hypothetical protein